MSFGVEGLAGSGAAGLPARVLASGVVGPGTLEADGGVIPAASAAGALAATSFTADALALLAYNRSSVLTTPRGGVAVQLNVASAGLKRPAEGFLMAPLESLHESSPFGQRISPISGAPGEFHWGQDYSAPCGTRVYSADAGVVRAVGWHPWGGGNRVEIDHGNGLVTTYNHLEGIAVKKGDSVRVGQVIARVGTTGSSTGCHLHFETILHGSHKNPPRMDPPADRADGPAWRPGDDQLRAQCRAPVEYFTWLGDPGFPGPERRIRRPSSTRNGAAATAKPHRDADAVHRAADDAADRDARSHTDRDAGSNTDRASDDAADRASDDRDADAHTDRDADDPARDDPARDDAHSDADDAAHRAANDVAHRDNTARAHTHRDPRLHPYPYPDD
nr:M23 family metallopeptidase [Arthrobacter sp. H16F315]